MSPSPCPCFQCARRSETAATVPANFAVRDIDEVQLRGDPRHRVLETEGLWLGRFSLSGAMVRNDATFDALCLAALMHLRVESPQTWSPRELEGGAFDGDRTATAQAARGKENVAGGR
jgi:hypothetical protein